MNRTSAEIIRDIATIYEELEILPSIREHQARVAGIILILKEHWKSDAPAVNWDDAVAAALLHDLGNIAKANLDTPIGQAMLGPIECERLEYWRDVKARTIAMYGGDEHTVTTSLVHKTNASDRVFDILIRTSFTYNKELVDNNDWERKLVGYADRVTGPFGVLTLDERIKEASQRYGYIVHEPHKRTPIVQAAFDLQAQIQPAVSIPLDAITEKNVEQFVQRFLARD